MVTIDEHNLGDCERDEGYLCDSCRQEYQERIFDMDWQDRIDEQYSLDNER